MTESLSSNRVRFRRLTVSCQYATIGRVFGTVVLYLSKVPARSVAGQGPEERIRKLDAAGTLEEIPTGTRDLLPDETARVRQVATGVLECMRGWGYREVTTPTLEYLDVLVLGEGSAAGDQLFKLVDRGGEILALRPEMTTSVARLVATRLRTAPLPLRLAYAGQVFRWREAGSGRLREFPQVGCELIGAGSLEADAEIVALAVEALAAAGVGQFSISLGHVGFLRGLLAGLTCPSPTWTTRRRCFIRRISWGSARCSSAIMPTRHT